MTLVSKLLPALSAGVLVVALTDGASATKAMRPRPPMVETQQNRPARGPAKAVSFPAKGVQPLTPEIEQALRAEGQLQGMRRLPRNGGGAEGLVHHGHADQRNRSLQGRGPAASRQLCAAVRGRPLHDLVRRMGCLPRRRRLRRQQGRRQDSAAAACRRRASISRRRNPIWPGCRARSAAPTGCRANPSANISPAPAPRHRSGSATPSRRKTPTIVAIDPLWQRPARRRTARARSVVDSYAPNPFGLYQVHGNVLEWTEDCFNKRYTEDTPTDGAPWLEGDCTSTWCAAAPGTGRPICRARAIATSAISAAATAFAWSGR